MYIEVSGLKPLTRHYLYLNGINQETKAKQYGKKLGDPLIAEETGKLKISLYIDSGIQTTSSGSLAYRVQNLNPGIKEVVFTTLYAPVLPDGYESSSLSYAKILISI